METDRSRTSRAGLLAIALLACAPHLHADAGWWNRSYTARVRVDLASPAEEALVEFPIAVRLSPETPGWEQMQRGGFRFVDADHRTVLPHEIAWWHAERGAEIHVLVPKLAPRGEADAIWMYFGGGTRGHYQARALWRGYVAVYHLTQVQGPYADSTGQHHSTEVLVANRDNSLGFGGGPAPDFVGRQGNGGEHIDLGNWNVSGQQMSIEALFQTDDQIDRRIVCKSDGIDDSNHTWMLNGYGGDRYVVRYRQKAGGRTQVMYGTEIIEKGAWVHAAGVYDGKEMRIYHNGQLAGLAGQSGPIEQEPHRIWLGGNPASILPDDAQTPDQQFFDGRIDEVRISSVARSASWMAATAAGLLGRLCAFGAVERPAVPGEGPKLSAEEKREQDAAELLARAQKLEEAGNLSEALASYDRAAELDGTAAADLARQAGLRLIRDPRLAARLERQRLDSEPRRLLQVGRAHLRAGQRAEAEQVLRQLIAEYPGSPQAAEARGLISR